MSKQSNGLWDNAFMIGGVIIEDTLPPPTPQEATNDNGFTDEMEHTGFAINMQVPQTVH